MLTINKKRFYYFIMPFILILLMQCSTPLTEQRTNLSVNEFIYYTMKDVYLWYNEIPNLDYNQFNDPEVLFNTMLHRNKDRWSFIQKIDRTLSLKYNEAYGFGFSPVWVNDSTDDQHPDWALKVAYVTSGSSAASAGLQRGDRIININSLYLPGLSPSAATDSLIQAEIQKQADLSLRFITKNLQDITLTLTKIKYTINPILQSSIIPQNGKKIGYFVFNSFDYTGDPTDQSDANDNQGLDNLFSSFKSNGISELIIDLRYNGGGSLDISRYLACLINGKDTEGKIFNRSYLNNRNYENYDAPYFNSVINYLYNEAGTVLLKMQPAQNTFTYRFIKLTNRLDLKRVFVITSGATASASEALIMGLKPFVDVVLVGTTTHGKPVGMISIIYKNYVFYPIMFRGYNALGEGDFYDGISVDQTVADDLTKNLGDTTEACLSEVLYYIDNNIFLNLPGSRANVLPMNHDKMTGNRLFF